MPKIGEIVQYRELSSDTPRAAIVTSVDEDTETVGLGFFEQHISHVTEYVPFKKDAKDKVNHEDATSGYEPAGKPATPAAK